MENNFSDVIKKKKKRKKRKKKPKIKKGFYQFVRITKIEKKCLKIQELQ